MKKPVFLKKTGFVSHINNNQINAHTTSTQSTAKRMTTFLGSFNLTTTQAGFLTCRSTVDSPSHMLTCHTMVSRIFLPAYSDRIAQDFHLIPSLTSKRLSADALELGYGIYTNPF